MTETLPHVVVPYAEFLDRCERRRRIVAELRRLDAQPLIDAEAAGVVAARPRSIERTYRYEGPGRLKKAERATSRSR